MFCYTAIICSQFTLPWILSQGIAFALVQHLLHLLHFQKLTVLPGILSFRNCRGNLGLCSLVSSSVISVCQSLRIIAVILAIHLGSFWRSFRCYSLKLGDFAAGPWAPCDRILLEQWTGVRARPGAAMQVCALC